MLAMAVAPLPREIIKWLQSLDLSYSVKNPKRDLSNGYLVAEILSKYKDISMNRFDNGTRLAAKVDNWDQLSKIFKKHSINITKQEIEPVIHCAPGAANAFLLHLHNVLTKRAIRFHPPKEQEQDVEAYRRHTASHRLKANELSHIHDTDERERVAHMILGSYLEERRALKVADAPVILAHQQRQKMGRSRKNMEITSKEEVQDSVQVDEVRVNALSASAAQLRGKQQQGEQQQNSGSAGRNKLLLEVCEAVTSVGALAGMQQAGLNVKPATDLLRPLVLDIFSESEELIKMIDTKKDAVVSFMEQCKLWPEEISARVFDTFADRVKLLVDTLTKSPPEFWKVWSTFFPALTDFPEISRVFDSAVYLFKRLGELMREVDPTLTQQLITDVGLLSLSKELSRAPEKRDNLCQIIYCYTQKDTLNHLLVLRALKEKVKDPNVYISCLSCLVCIDASLNLLDEHFLDLYIYYALMAMQSPQPKIRVAGVSILSTITMSSTQHQSIVALIPSFADLATDDWWEVQAQLLILCANLLGKVSVAERQECNLGDVEEGSASGKDQSQGEENFGNADVAESLLAVIGRLFVESNSKNVLQVGLSALVHLLADYPILLPIFVSVLLEQPVKLRQRLLQPVEAGSEGGESTRKRTYVMGSSSRLYEERCVSSLWPHLDVAKTFVRQLEASPLDHFELEHVEVFMASLPENFEEHEADEWLDIFEKVKQYIFVALVDPDLHLHSTKIIKRFWLCPVERIATRSIEGSKRTLLKALRLLYRNLAQGGVDEAAVVQFLRDLRNRGGIIQIEVTMMIESFRDTHPAEYAGSQLDTVLA